MKTTAKTTKTRPLRKWTKVPVFCTGETHEICWNEKGQLWLPQHPSFDLAAIEAMLLRGEGRLDNLCLTFAGALRGSLLCLEALQQSMRFLHPQLAARIEQMATRARGRQTAQQERDKHLLEHYPLTLEKCARVFEATALGRLDTGNNNEGHTVQITRRHISVRSLADPRILFRVGLLGSVLRIELAIDPKKWASLYAQNKVILYDPNTDHPSKVAFALMPGEKRGFLYCVRYKQFITPHELELAHARVRRIENTWMICDPKVHL